MNAYTKDKGLYQAPGMDPTTVKSWSHYNIGEDVPSRTSLNEVSLLSLLMIRYPRPHPEQCICISGTWSWPKRQHVRFSLCCEKLPERSWEHLPATGKGLSPESIYFPAAHCSTLLTVMKQGMFTVPVCQLQYYNWKQSDQMGSKAPCDCRKYKPSVDPSLIRGDCNG